MKRAPSPAETSPPRPAQLTLPSHRHRRISRSVCLPSVTDEPHMGVIFLIATFDPDSRFFAAHTTPYAPLPSAFSGV